MTLKEIENIEKSNNKLEIKEIPTNISKKLSLSDFVKELITNFVVDNNTYENNVLQCPSDRNRSFGDLYRITLSYYPNTTVKEMYLIINSLINDGVICSIICSTIGKRVYTIEAYENDFYDNEDDEYGNTYYELINMLENEHS